MVLAGMLEYVVGQTVKKETPIYVQKTLLTVMSGVVTQVRKHTLSTLYSIVLIQIIVNRYDMKTT